MNAAGKKIRFGDRIFDLGARAAIISQRCLIGVHNSAPRCTSILYRLEFDHSHHDHDKDDDEDGDDGDDDDDDDEEEEEDKDEEKDGGDDDDDDEDMLHSWNPCHLWSCKIERHMGPFGTESPLIGFKHLGTCKLWRTFFWRVNTSKNATYMEIDG